MDPQGLSEVVLKGYPLHWMNFHAQTPTLPWQYTTAPSTLLTGTGVWGVCVCLNSIWSGIVRLILRLNSYA